MKKFFIVLAALAAMVFLQASCKKDSEEKITPEKEWGYMDEQSGCYQVLSFRDGVFTNGMIINDEYYKVLLENKPGAAAKIKPGDLVGLKNSYVIYENEDGTSGSIEAKIKNPGSEETFNYTIPYTNLTMDNITLSIGGNLQNLTTLSSLGITYGSFLDMVEYDLL